MTWGVHISLAPTWFDPAETPGIITPFMVLYALHDAMVKAMPGNPMAPSLAESWTVSPDGLTYEFVAPQGREVPQRRAGHRRGREVLVRALPRHLGQDHQGARRRGRDARPAPRPLPAEAAVARLHDVLHRRPPAPAGSCRRSTSRRSATTASRRRRSAPARTGSSRSRPGVELVMEAFDGYWRKTPSVKRLVFKVISDESTRLAALKRGEIDIVYSIRGELAEELQRTPGLTLKPDGHPGAAVGQLRSTSGIRSRRGTTGGCASPPTSRSTARRSTRRRRSGTRGSPTASSPSTFDFFWPPPAYRVRSRPGQEAPGRGRISRTASTPATTTCDIVVRERAARPSPTTSSRSASARSCGRSSARRYWSSYADKKYKNLAYTASGAFGNAATRLEAFVVGGRHVRVRQLPGHRRALPGAGGRARPRSGARRCSTRSSSSCTRRRCSPRSGSWRFMNGHGPARAGVGPRPDPRPRLLGALRGREAQGQVARGETRPTAGARLCNAGRPTHGPPTMSFDVSAGAPASATAVWACRSWFCQQPGPFWVKSLDDARVRARAHTARKFLGLFSHQAMACSLHDKRVNQILRDRGQGRPTSRPSG